MSDITTIWNNANSRGDWTLIGPDLQNGFDLQTALLISLFSDRLAHDSDAIPDGTTNRRGWWGDEGETYPIGSRLWLIDRSKLDQDVANAARGYIIEALQWFIDDGVVAAFDIATEIIFPNQLIATIQAYRSRAAQIAKNYDWAWTGPIVY